jgi:hypothetical protein
LAIGERPAISRVVRPGAAPLSEYVVAVGRSIHSRRGMLHEGAAIREKDFSTEGWARLLAQGCVARRDGK